jgi:hypothetical protein
VGREVRGARREAREVRVAVEVLGMFHPLRGLGVRVAIRVREDLRELEVVLRRPRLEKLVLLRSVHERGDGGEEVLPRGRVSVAVLLLVSAASSAACRRVGRGGEERRGGHSSHHGSSSPKSDKHSSSSSPKGSSSSNTGGRTKTGSGVTPNYGGGRYYGGGATTPYQSGSRSPLGIAAVPLAFGVGALAFYPGIWLYGAYAYPYSHVSDP